MIKIRGTPESVPAIEEAISGVSVDVTLLFITDHYRSAAQALLRSSERRIDAGLKPDIASLVSVFVSRWDAALNAHVSTQLHNQLGLATAKRIYPTARTLLCSPRWHPVYNLGARSQRLLWASTGAKDPQVWETSFVEALAAPLHGKHYARGDPESGFHACVN